MPDPNLRRVALVIGNARYTNAPVLTNSPSDAASVSAALREAGFQTVTVKTDLSQQATLIALREFASLADAADWAAAEAVAEPAEPVTEAVGEQPVEIAPEIVQSVAEIVEALAQTLEPVAHAFTAGATAA